MRMSFEVLAGEVEKVPVLRMHGIDSDFAQSMYKVQVWREFDKVKDCVIRGTVLEVKFNAMKPADGRFEKVPVISVPQDNLRIIKSAEQALRDLQKSIANHGQAEAA